MYVKLDDGNGGIVLNLGTGGLSIQAVAELNSGQDLVLHFKFSDTGETVTIAGRAAWLGPTRKEAGICFKDLSDQTVESIARWIVRQETGSPATEQKVASPDPVLAASEIHLLPRRVFVASIPARGTALDPQPSRSTALPSKSRLEDTLPDRASSEPSTPLAFDVSFPSPIPTDALHPNEYSAASTASPTEVPLEPSQPILRHETARSSGPSNEFLRRYREPSDSPIQLSSTGAVSGNKWIPLRLMLSFAQGKRRQQKLIVVGLTACFGIFLLILTVTRFGKHSENARSSATSVPMLSVSPPAAVAPDAIPAASPSSSMSSPAPISAPPQIVRRRTEASWQAKLKRILLGIDDSPALDPAIDGISVWTDRRSGFYFCADSPFFAKLQPGSLVTQGNALQSGYQPKLGSYCR